MRSISYSSIVQIVPMVFLLAFLSSAAFAQRTEPYFIGTWKAKDWEGTSKNFEFIKLKKDGSGMVGQGVTDDDGLDKLVPFLLKDIKQWEVRNDTLLLHGVPEAVDGSGTLKSKQYIYLIKDKRPGSFKAQYKDPELEKLMAQQTDKAQSTLLLFKKDR